MLLVLLFNQALDINLYQSDVITYRKKECLGQDKSRKVEGGRLVVVAGGGSSGSMWNGVGQALSHAQTRSRTHAVTHLHVVNEIIR